MLTAEQPTTQQKTVVLLPKNRGLAGQLARLRESYAAFEEAAYSVRGEDIPFLASELSRLGRSAVAFTGDDLLDEWLADGNALDERLVRRRIAWSDPSAIYGAPALCLIGESHSVLAEKRPLRVAVCNRYRRLTERFLWALRADGIELEALPIAGSLETCLQSGVTDLVVDIVVTGATIRRSGLRVLRVISTSDIAVLETQSEC